MRTSFEDAKRIADAICNHKKTNLTALTWMPSKPNQWVANFSYIDGQNTKTVDRVGSYVEIDRDVSFERHLDDYDENSFFYEEEVDEPEAGKSDL